MMSVVSRDRLWWSKRFVKNCFLKHTFKNIHVNRLNNIHVCLALWLIRRIYKLAEVHNSHTASMFSRKLNTHMVCFRDKTLGSNEASDSTCISKHSRVLLPLAHFPIHKPRGKLGSRMYTIIRTRVVHTKAFKLCGIELQIQEAIPRIHCDWYTTRQHNGGCLGIIRCVSFRPSFIITATRDGSAHPIDTLDAVPKSIFIKS
mmetsp:Transcript_11349/g.22162  ORF Transcript_11349/g.22162 Transcript_11349/m.22162 type:complete len:202 (-) Transcript_11349:506-1111(-)